MAKVYPLDYQPNLDLDWSVNPGACSDMERLVPMQNQTLVSCDFDGPVGFNVTGGDALHAQVFGQVNGSGRFLVFRVSNIDEYSTTGVRTNRGTGYNVATEDWSATIWGNQVIACNYLDATQSSTGGGFAALGGGAPKARYVASNINFVLFADVDDGGANVFPDMVWWSGIRNANTYTPSPATQAGYIRLLDAPGPIRQVFQFGDKFLAFKENSIFVGQYVGPPAVFSWKLISNTVGCSYPKTVTELDGRVYFVHRTGVYAYDGQTIENIGLGVASNMNSERFDTAIWNGRARGDATEGIVWFASLNADVQAFTQWQMFVYAYNVRSRRWSRVGKVCQSSAAANNSRPVMVFGNTNELYSYRPAWGRYAGFAWLDNGATPKASNLLAPFTPDGAAYFVTGYIGENENASRYTRVYLRLLGGGATCVASGTLTGYPGIPNSASGSVGMTWNSENNTLDGQLAARYKTVRVDFTTGQGGTLAGLGIGDSAGGTR